MCGHTPISVLPLACFISLETLEVLLLFLFSGRMAYVVLLSSAFSFDIYAYTTLNGNEAISCKINLLMLFFNCVIVKIDAIIPYSF